MIHGAKESDSGCYACLTKTKIHSLTYWEPKQLVCVRVTSVQEKREEEQREEEWRRKLNLFRIESQMLERKKEMERAEQRKTLGTLFLVVLGMIVIPAFIYCMCLGVSKIKAARNRAVESESREVGKSLKIGKNRIGFPIRLFGKNAKMP